MGRQIRATSNHIIFNKKMICIGMNKNLIQQNQTSYSKKYVAQQ